MGREQNETFFPSSSVLPLTLSLPLEKCPYLSRNATKKLPEAKINLQPEAGQKSSALFGCSLASVPYQMVYDRVLSPLLFCIWVIKPVTPA